MAEIFSQPKTDIGRQLVYPNGVQIDRLPPSRVIRVAFNGGSSYEPLIASLAIDCGVKVNILGADTRNIEGKAFGTMLLGLPKEPEEAAKALRYIQSQPGARRGSNRRSPNLCRWAEYGTCCWRHGLDYGGRFHRFCLSSSYA